MRADLQPGPEEARAAHGLVVPLAGAVVAQRHPRDGRADRGGPLAARGEKAVDGADAARGGGDDVAAHRAVLGLAPDLAGGEDLPAPPDTQPALPRRQLPPRVLQLLHHPEPGVAALPQRAVRRVPRRVSRAADTERLPHRAPEGAAAALWRHRGGPAQAAQGPPRRDLQHHHHAGNRGSHACCCQ